MPVISLHTSPRLCGDSSDFCTIRRNVASISVHPYSKGYFSSARHLSIHCALALYSMLDAHAMEVPMAVHKSNAMNVSRSSSISSLINRFFFPHVIRLLTMPPERRGRLIARFQWRFSHCFPHFAT